MVNPVEGRVHCFWSSLALSCHWATTTSLFIILFNCVTDIQGQILCLQGSPDGPEQYVVNILFICPLSFSSSFYTHCFWSFQICCSNERNILCTTLYGTLMLLVFLVVLHSAHTILYWPISEMLSSFHLDQLPFPHHKAQILHHPEWLVISPFFPTIHCSPSLELISGFFMSPQNIEHNFIEIVFIYPAFCPSSMWA